MGLRYEARESFSSSWSRSPGRWHPSAAPQPSSADSSPPSSTPLAVAEDQDHDEEKVHPNMREQEKMKHV